MRKLSLLERRCLKFTQTELHGNTQVAYFVGKYALDPQGFIENELKMPLFDWQLEIVDYIAKFFRKNSDEKHFVCAIAVSGGNGTGKTKLSKALNIWRFCCHPGSRQFILTNSERQTKRTGFTMLVRRISKLLSCIAALESSAYYYSPAVADKPEVRTNDMWDVTYLLQSSTEAALSGLHHPMMTFSFDESTYFNDHVWQALENMWTQGQVLCFCTGNPSHDNNNYFARLFNKSLHKKDSLWLTRCVSLLELPLKYRNDARARYIEEHYGKTHPRYIASVLGQFPKKNTCNPFDITAISEAMEREVREEFIHHPVIMGIDVSISANNGSASAICVREGTAVRVLREYRCHYTEFRIKLLELLQEIKPTIVVVDANGVGFGLYEELHRTLPETSNVRVYGVRAHAEAFLKSEYADKMSELAKKSSEWFNNELVSIPKNYQFLNALTSLSFADASGKIKLIGKTDAKKKVDLSMDMADAFFLTFLDGVEMDWAQGVKDNYLDQSEVYYGV
ncbi:terminase [Abalone shriveling syndrome-associated virus]|uniref:terminase n=1 Tax=Abalone shriveling syndrome-associated virus TaxID=491893 RepID=UPI0001881BC1|nr:terminase [Abalone shriveling syndrome-associated virus]ACJ72002.1 terminase [Abalone shriveling syndrome-associated virus]